MRRTSHTAHRRSAGGLAALLIVGGSAGTVRAQTGPLPSDARDQQQQPIDEATRLFQRGTSLYLDRKYGEALEVLRQSHRLVPSPNSRLLIARCLRELGRRPEAVSAYADVEAEARRLAGEQDPAYAKTAEAAAAEGAAVRSTLGALRIHLDHAPRGTDVDADGELLATTASGDAFAWHAPGMVTVRARTSSGTEASRTVSLVAGSDVRVVLDLGGPISGPAMLRSDAPTPPPPLSDSRSSPAWLLPAAGVAGALGLVGLGVFAGFGSSSHAAYLELRDRCGPHACGAADQADADRGMSNQRIANVGLIVGIVGVASAVALLTARFTTTGASPR